MLSGIFNDRAQSEIRNMIISELEKIQIKAGLCRFNNRCHLNSVHDAIEAKQDKLAMCFCVPKKGSGSFIHFINIDSKGAYIDNTLGHWSRKYDYYLIKIIIENEFFNVENIFAAYRKNIRSRLGFFTRIFSNTTC